MKRKLVFIAICLGAALSSLVLCGFKLYDREFFPAPFVEPLICFYSNLNASRLYENDEAMQKVIKYACDICEYRAFNADKAKLKNAITAIVSDKILSGIIKPSEIFFYLNKPNEFMLLLTGEFSVKEICSYIGASYLTPIHGGFKAEFTLPFNKSRATVSIKQDKLLIASSEIFEVVSDHIEFNNNLLSKDFDTFNQMVRANSAIALEASLSGSCEQNRSMGAPYPFCFVKRLRFLAHNKQIKLQLFVPNSKQRSELDLYLEPFISGLNESFNYLREFKKSSKGSSIFVSAASDAAFTGSLEARLYSFFLHFFAV